MAYGTVEETFWHDETIRRLSEDGRNFMLYLLTCPHRNRIGLYVLDPYYAGADLQWTPDRVLKARDELVAAGRIAWDEGTRTVYMANHWKHNVLQNPQAVRGAITELRSVPQTRLAARLLADLQTHGRAHYRDLIAAVAKRVENSPKVPDRKEPRGNPVNGPNNEPLTCSDNSSETETEPLAYKDESRLKVENSSVRFTDAKLRAVALAELGLGRLNSAPDHIKVGREVSQLVEKFDRENVHAALKGLCVLRDQGLVGLKKGTPYTPGILLRWGRVWWGEGDQRTQRTLYDVAQDVYRNAPEPKKRHNGAMDTIGDVLAQLTTPGEA